MSEEPAGDGGGRRRPRPLGSSEAVRARQELGLQLVAEERRPPTLGRVAEQLFVGFLRRPGAPYTVEIVDLATGQLVGAEPADGTRAEAHGLYLVMSADLDRMDRRAFLRKWGRRRRR